MATYAAYRHIELDKVGAGKKRYVDFFLLTGLRWFVGYCSVVFSVLWSNRFIDIVIGFDHAYFFSEKSQMC